MSYFCSNFYVPKHILYIILNYLNFEDLRNLKNTCSKFYKIIKFLIEDIPKKYHNYRTAEFFPNVKNLNIKLEEIQSLDIMDYIFKMGPLSLGLFIKDYLYFKKTVYLPANKSIKISGLKHIQFYKIDYENIIELKLGKKEKYLCVEPCLKKMINLEKLYGHSVDISFYTNIKFYKTTSSLVLKKKINADYIECENLTIELGGSVKKIMCNFLQAVDTKIDVLHTFNLNIKNCFVGCLIIPKKLKMNSSIFQTNFIKKIDNTL